MAIQTEIWKNELLKKFRAMGSHFDGVPDYSSDVLKGKIIHLADIGADPAVLFNNTSYPIATVVQTDTDLPMTLNLFETVNTIIPYQSLFNLPYDKKKAVIENHKEVLHESYIDRATHAMAPTTDSTDTPLVVTTGAIVAPSVRKKLTIADIISLKRKFDDLKIPKVGRRLVMCSEHVEDLLQVSESFDKQYNVDRKEGRIGRLYGFDIYEYATMPAYNETTGTYTKLAFGSAVAGTDAVASIAYYVPRVFKAVGELIPFLREAKDDPENRQTTVGYSLRAIILPKKSTGVGAAIGAIVSDF